MIDESEHGQELRSLLESQRFAVLSTRREDGQAYASLVAFSVSPDLKRLTFCTQRATRKFANLEVEDRVALLVDNRSNEELDLQKAAAVTILGRCAEVSGEGRADLSEAFLARHPALAAFVKSPGCAVMEVKVHSYYLVTRFQNVVEFHVQEGGRGDPEQAPD